MFRYADERINRLRVVARSWLARLPVASRLYVPIKLARGMRYLKRSHHDAVCPPFLTLFDEIRDRSMKEKKKKRNGSAFVEDILTISHPISYSSRYDTLCRKSATRNGDPQLRIFGPDCPLGRASTDEKIATVVGSTIPLDFLARRGGGRP